MSLFIVALAFQYMYVYRIHSLKPLLLTQRYSQPTWQHNQLTPRQHYRDKQIALIDTWLRKITAATESGQTRI